MVSKIIDIAGRTVILAVLLSAFGFAMYVVGQNSVAQRFCEVRGFQSGFTMLPGIVCRAHIPFPYDPMTKPTK